MTRNQLKALALSLGLFAASGATAQDRCGTHELHQYYLQNDPGYAQRFQDTKAAAEAYNASGQNRQRVVVTIPIVVHVVHNGEALGVGANISDAQILSQIEVLNEDYRFLNTDASLIPGVFQSLAADMEVEFCLAIRDPDGNTTTGINRINGGRANWSMTQVETDLKPTTTWDTDRYLNIWTLKLGGANAQTLGYSSFPGQSQNGKGVVVQHPFFGRVGNLTSPFNKGRTCTHEIGHFLGLEHIWGPNDPGVSNCGDSDGVLDTPNQDKANYGCPTFPKISCSNGPNGDMFMNYMDYVNDACMFMFTEGQKSRTTSHLNTTYASLVASTACTRFTLDAALVELVYPKSTVCLNTFRPVVLVRNEGSQTITSLLINNVVDQSNFTQLQWTGSLAPGEEIYITLGELTYADGPHELNVYLSNPNNGTDQFGGNNSVDINFTIANDANAIAALLPLAEGFEGGTFPPSQWNVSSIGGASGAWAQAPYGAFNISISAAGVDFFTGNTNGQKQSLTTPLFEVPMGQSVALSFSYAYARKDSLTNDSLTIYFSLDCGATWKRFWSKQGIHLQTAPAQNTAFAPGSGDWERVIDLNLPQLQGQERTQIRFEAVSKGGNNIYLDDINLEYWTVGMGEKHQIMPLKLYPNPASKQVTVQAEGLQGQAQVTVYDLQGKMQLRQNITATHSTLLDISSLSTGMYLVKLTTAKGEGYSKLVVE